MKFYTSLIIHSSNRFPHTRTHFVSNIFINLSSVNSVSYAWQKKWIDLWTVNAKMCTYISVIATHASASIRSLPQKQTTTAKKPSASKSCNRKNNNYNAFLIALSDRDMPQWQTLKNIRKCHIRYTIHIIFISTKKSRKNPTRMHSSRSFHRRYNLFNLMFQRDRFHFALCFNGEKMKSKKTRNKHALFAYNTHCGSSGWKRCVQNKLLNDSSERRKKQRITTTPIKMTTEKVNTAIHTRTRTHLHTHNKHEIGSWSYECQVISFSCEHNVYKIFCWGHSQCVPQFLPLRIRWNDLDSLRFYVFILFCHSWTRARGKHCLQWSILWTQKIQHACVSVCTFISTCIFYNVVYICDCMTFLPSLLLLVMLMLLCRFSYLLNYA